MVEFDPKKGHDILDEIDVEIDHCMRTHKDWEPSQKEDSFKDKMFIAILKSLKLKIGRARALFSEE